MYAYQLTVSAPVSQLVFPPNVDGGAGFIKNLGPPVFLTGGLNLPSMTPYVLGSGETIIFKPGSEGIGGLTVSIASGSATLNIILHSVTYVE